MLNPLDGLNEHQQQVVTATHGPVLVLAGAGSGKTRALTHRIAYLLYKGLAQPEQILAVTFTNKAAGEMKERVAQLTSSSAAPVHGIGTFHGLGAKLLRETAAFHTRSKQFVIIDSKDSIKLVRTALKEQNVSLREWSPAAIRARISSAKNKEYSPQDVLEEASEMAGEIVAKAYQRYEQLLAEHNGFDFDDLLIKPVQILRSHPDLAKGYQQRWKFLSVDEYQDTNPLQEELLQLLTGPEKNICVVGDDYQAIYSWRGANVDHILGFERRYPTCTTIYLTQNYRSTPQILDAANQVIAANEHQKHKELWTDAATGEEIQVLSLPSDRHESEHIRFAIDDHVQRGGKLRDCAILYRTNAQSRLFEEEFLTHRIPYTIIGGFRFYDRREVKDALAFLHLLMNPNARLSIDRIADALWSGIGPKTIDRWAEKAQQEGTSLLDQIINNASTRPQLMKVSSAFGSAQAQGDAQVSDTLQMLLAKSGYITWLKNQVDAEERIENINELLNVTSAYEDINTFLEEAALLSDIDTLENSEDRVTCMTLHAAKGLEFPVVFVVGCEEGLLPHTSSLYESQGLEEERRLLYVGMTRAQKYLTITHASQRYTAGEMTPQMPSRFLESLRGSTAPAETVSSTEPVLVSAEEGDIITHPRFGRGVVISTQASDITCVFERHGVQTISGATLV